MPKTIEFSIRLPSSIHRRVKAAATKSHRTMNGEIVARLESTFDVDLINEAIDSAKEAAKLGVETTVVTRLEGLNVLFQARVGADTLPPYLKAAAGEVKVFKTEEGD
jgi:hypothetical protein